MTLGCFVTCLEFETTTNFDSIRYEVPFLKHWVASELVKNRCHHGERARLHFYRDRKGFEIDFLLQLGAKTVVIETKSGATVAKDFFAALDIFEIRDAAFWKV